MRSSVSVVIPARDEARSLRDLLPQITDLMPDAEVVVVDDGSVDATAEVARSAGARVVSHPYGMGNGAAVKTGARAATGDVLIFMDADGQHAPSDIPQLLTLLDSGYDMAVGARDRASQANLGRLYANTVYNKLASWMVGHRVQDLTSGFRAVRAAQFREFLFLLPNGFSYPSTVTMAFFRAGYPVAYAPIDVRARSSDTKSHIQPLRDGIRFLLILFRVATLYSPLKIFFPVAIFHLILGVCYYGYTFITESRFTNMGALLLMTGVVILMMGLLSEQITALVYSSADRARKTTESSVIAPDPRAAGENPIPSPESP